MLIALTSTEKSLFLSIISFLLMLAVPLFLVEAIASLTDADLLCL